MNEIKPFTDAYSIHLYCEHCGKELNKELYSTNSFDKKTGKEIYNLKVICLNKKHFNIEHLVKIADVLEIDICEFFK